MTTDSKLPTLPGAVCGRCGRWAEDGEDVSCVLDWERAVPSQPGVGLVPYLFVCEKCIEPVDFDDGTL